MEETLKRSLKEQFNRFFTENIENIILESISQNKIEDKTQITLNQQELYEDWIESIENAILPNLEKVEESFHKDGIYVKLIYSIETERAKHVRKIKIKSNGKVDISNFIYTWKKINGKIYELKIEYDVYGNLIIYFMEIKGLKDGKKLW